MTTIELQAYRPDDVRDIGVMVCAADVITKARALGKELVMPDGKPINPDSYIILTKRQLDALGLTWRDF